LLLDITKQLFTVSLVFLVLTGCVSKSGRFSKSYHYSTYSHHSHNNNHNNKTKIRDSKAMHRATMHPYTVLGKKYYPRFAHVGEVFKGVASWYGPNFNAKKTSNGEIYNMYAYTAAHKTLPMNTMVRVKNLENGKEVLVRINDRGPFVKSRIIDLSNVAAHKIDMIKKGTTRVKLTILGFNGKIAKTKYEKRQKQISEHFYLQVGVFGIRKSATTLKRKLSIVLNNTKYKIILKNDKLNDEKVQRVWITGFRSEQEAENFKEDNQLSLAVVIAE